MEVCVPINLNQVVDTFGIKNMPKKLIEMTVSGTADTVLVAVESLNTPLTGKVSKDGDFLVEKVDTSFNAVRELITKTCCSLAPGWEEIKLETGATSAEVEFGISFTGKGSIYLVESSVGANLKIKITWSPK